MEKVLRVGKMPGRINEVVVAVGTTIKEVLEHAELDAKGFDIKVDGQPATLETVVTERTNLVILAQQVKGNSSEKVVRVGKMPGRINEVVVPIGATVQEVLNIAELDPKGFDIKVDGQVAQLTSTITANTNLIILAQQVKGNSGEKVVRVGKMPGRINEVVVPIGSTIKEVLTIAELDARGFDIKVDGQVSTLESTITANTNLIILAQQVKGN